MGVLRGWRFYFETKRAQKRDFALGAYKTCETPQFICPHERFLHKKSPKSGWFA